MAQQKNPTDQQNAQRADPGPAQRSENLLPGDAADDARYDVAEEVNLDQQSDALRRVGKPPKGIASSALPDDWQDDAAAQDDTDANGA